MREIIASRDVFENVNEPWPRYRTGARHIQFRARLDHFTSGARITVAENPHSKPGYAFLARTDPVSAEIWDIRVVEPDQGIRCFGAFGGRDLFVALTWEYRENIEGFEDFEDEVKRCRAEWDRLFSPILPFKGRSIDEYASNILPV